MITFHLIIICCFLLSLIASNPRNKIVQTKNNDTILGTLHALTLRLKQALWGFISQMRKVKPKEVSATHLARGGARIRTQEIWLCEVYLSTKKQ